MLHHMTSRFARRDKSGCQCMFPEVADIQVTVHDQVICKIDKVSYSSFAKSLDEEITKTLTDIN